MGDTEDFVDLLRKELIKLDEKEWRDYRKTMSDLMRTRTDLDEIKAYATDDTSTDARIRLLAKTAVLKKREFDETLYQTNPLFGRF